VNQPLRVGPATHKELAGNMSGGSAVDAVLLAESRSAFQIGLIQACRLSVSADEATSNIAKDLCALCNSR